MFVTLLSALLWASLGLTLWHISGLQASLSATDPTASGDLETFAASCSTEVCTAWVVVYMTMVLFHQSVEKFFQSLPGFDKLIVALMQTYNPFQVAFNGLWCVLMLYVLLYRRAEKPQPLIGALEKDGFGFDPALAQLLWLHYANKFIEFFDTFTMITRGKAKQQMSFLHISHHAMMGFAWLVVLKYYPQGDSWFGAFANSFIHVLMYAYYFVAQQGRSGNVICATIAKRCKKAITVLQLTQFVFCLVHAVLCGWVLESVPAFICAVQIGVMMWMLVWFVDFFTKTYRGGKGAEGQGVKDAGAKDAGAKDAPNRLVQMTESPLVNALKFVSS